MTSKLMRSRAERCSKENVDGGDVFARGGRVAQSNSVAGCSCVVLSQQALKNYLLRLEQKLRQGSARGNSLSRIFQPLGGLVRLRVLEHSLVLLRLTGRGIALRFAIIRQHRGSLLTLRRLVAGTQAKAREEREAALVAACRGLILCRFFLRQLGLPRTALCERLAHWHFTTWDYVATCLGNLAEQLVVTTAGRGDADSGLKMEVGLSEKVRRLVLAARSRAQGLQTSWQS